MQKRIVLNGALVCVLAAARVVAAENEQRAAQTPAAKAQGFDLRGVRLLDGPFKHAMEMDKQILLSLDADRLLQTFRMNAGVPSTAEPLGGWETPGRELRGATAGHYLTACSLMYASTGDERLKEKVNQVVSGLAECQEKLKSGYLSAFPEEHFDKLETGQKIWAPYYVIHKLLAGLIDADVYCQNPQALATAQKLADWVETRTSKLSDEQMQSMLNVEQGGITESLADLYSLSGDEKYLKLARRFNHLSVLSPASQRQDMIARLHANTQIPKFIGAAREYELTGDQDLKTAASFFWDTVVHTRTYAIGGTSDGEYFPAPREFSHTLGSAAAETCCTYNMLKLTRHLISWEPKAEYGDYYERALYNHILASQDPQSGMLCHYAPLASGGRKKYCTPTNSFSCCMDTGMESQAKYGESIYFHSGGNTLYVNLFIASELDWKTNGLKIRQETKYPEEQTTSLTFNCQKPVQLAVNLRHPWWAENGITVKVNGQDQHDGSTPASWAVVNRTWNNGDRLEISMPFSVRTERLGDNDKILAFMYGPLVLGAEVNTNKPPPCILGETTNLISGFTPLQGKPNYFAVSSESFRIAGTTNAQFTFEPYYLIHDNRNQIVYWRVLDTNQWARWEHPENFKRAASTNSSGRMMPAVLSPSSFNRTNLPAAKQ